MDAEGLSRLLHRDNTLEAMGGSGCLDRRECMNGSQGVIDMEADGHADVNRRAETDWCLSVRAGVGTGHSPCRRVGGRMVVNPSKETTDKRTILRNGCPGAFESIGRVYQRGNASYDDGSGVHKAPVPV